MDLLTHSLTPGIFTIMVFGVYLGSVTGMAPSPNSALPPLYTYRGCT